MGRVKKNPSKAAASGNDSDARNLVRHFALSARCPPPAPVRSACAFHTRTGMPHTRSFCHIRLNGCCGRSRTQTVNFTKLDLATLKSLKRHYRLKTREKATKSELAQAVAKHFAAENIDEV